MKLLVELMAAMLVLSVISAAIAIIAALVLAVVLLVLLWLFSCRRARPSSGTPLWHRLLGLVRRPLLRAWSGFR